MVRKSVVWRHRFVFESYLAITDIITCIKAALCGYLEFVSASSLILKVVISLSYDLSNKPASLDALRINM